MYIDIFPIKVKIFDLEKSDVEVLLDYVKSLSYYGNDMQGYMTNDQQILKNFNNIEKKIEAEVNQYSTDLKHKVKDIKIVNSWANKLSNKQIIVPHIHPNSYISGTIHLTEGSNLIFRQPTIDTFFNLSTEFIGPGDEFAVEPRAGRVTLFPSNITHNVNPADNIRYSIAFNTWPKNYGYPTSEVFL